MLAKKVLQVLLSCMFLNYSSSSKSYLFYKISRQLQSTDKPESKTKFFAGQRVRLFEPPNLNEVNGVTIFITGAFAPISIYDTLINSILSENQWVIGIVSNVLIPINDNHRYRAGKVKEVFTEFYKKYGDGLEEEKYNLVGHSAGGKASLLVAGVYDPDRVRSLIALDPYDGCPPEFTPAKEGETPNETLEGLSVPIILTMSGVYDQGVEQFNRAHSAEAIHEWNMNSTILVNHTGAGHSCYTDANCNDNIIPIGDPEANSFARNDTFNLIREYL